MLKPMDPTLLCQLVQGQPDVLTKEAEADAKFYRDLRCPLCSKGGCTKKLEAPLIKEGPDGTVLLRTPFGDGMLPEGYASCNHCGTEFDPYTKVVRSTEASIISSPQSDPLLE